MNHRLLKTLPHCRRGIRWPLLLGGLLISLMSCPSSPPPKPEIAPPYIEEIPPEPKVTTTQGILTRMAALLEREDYDGALALFDEIDPAEAETSGLRLVKASILSSAGRSGEGRVIVEEIIAGEPENTEALFVLSSIEKSSGREREQRALLERILKTDPSHVQALNGLGNIARQARSFRTAAAYFDRALEAAPEDREALIGRADVYRRERKITEAEGLLNKAVSLYPQWSVGLSERARLYRNAGYPLQALADLDKAKVLAGNDYWIAYDRGNVLLDLNRKPEALEEFNRAIALDPEVFLAYVYSAGIKDDLGDYDGAEKDYITLARLEPEYYFAFEGIGCHKMRQGLWGEARDAFAEVYKQAPQEWAYALLTAVNWMRAGKPSDPRQFLEQALRRVQRETLPWYMLRLYYDLAGDNDVAIRIDRERNPELKAKMFYYLAEYYDARGNKNLADRYFLQVRELDQRYILEWRLNEWALEKRNMGNF
ncbi:MAG: tetratricopeptide repeat protein [Spirochaetaceae bacterium]|nr:tetratricopeptide repeat protein [Spirochaetaceae bacterium]